ncbi:retinaldehyde-binding protein 1 [Folsomia candida]|nr:retinaldehyde-binding protein 1 [Folsomia candida]XP_021962951.1 retinaldehyde-binding protein 1 [Folsomia candida]XP_021962953.1 retinaldehyde-binding protein 1 [Folsomia candida]
MTLGPEPPAVTPSLQRLRSKAKHEIGEIDDLIPEQIAAIRTVLSEESLVNVPPKQFDPFLLRCLRARKFDIHRAAKTYKKFCYMNYNLSEITDYLLPSTYNGLIHSKFISILKSVDASGRQIVFIQVHKWHHAKHTLDEALGTLFMYIDQALDSVDTQLNGIVVLVDFKGFGFGHARQVTPAKVQAVVNMVQDSYPARFKEFHFYNHPTLFNMVFALAKPFLKEKIRKRIFFHGHDLASVHRSINPALLPACMGGALPDNAFIDEEALALLLKKDDYFNDMKENFLPILQEPEYPDYIK